MFHLPRKEEFSESLIGYIIRNASLKLEFMDWNVKKWQPHLLTLSDCYEANDMLFLCFDS